MILIVLLLFAGMLVYAAWDRHQRREAERARIEAEVQAWRAEVERATAAREAADAREREKALQIMAQLNDNDDQIRAAGCKLGGFGGGTAIQCANVRRCELLPFQADYKRCLREAFQASK